MEIRNLAQTLILGIESSCDETAAAVVEDGTRVRSSVVASQLIHAKYGGVVPELASREHLRAIVPVVRQALAEAEITLGDLSAVAVTAGPGLICSLLVCVSYGKALCFGLSIPLIAVNHVEGHIHSVLLAHPDLSLPALALVVSGGHTHLFEVQEFGHYRLLGKTRDDAAGEAYDKVAKLLGFGYPGGPIIDQLASHGDGRAVKFAASQIKHPNRGERAASAERVDFSFSGIKTAVLRYVETHGMKPAIEVRRAKLSAMEKPKLEDWLAASDKQALDLVASFQRAVV